MRSSLRLQPERKCREKRDGEKQHGGAWRRGSDGQIHLTVTGRFGRFRRASVATGAPPASGSASRSASAGTALSGSASLSPSASAGVRASLSVLSLSGSVRCGVFPCAPEIGVLLQVGPSLPVVRWPEHIGFAIGGHARVRARLVPTELLVRAILSVALPAALGRLRKHGNCGEPQECQHELSRKRAPTSHIFGPRAFAPKKSETYFKKKSSEVVVSNALPDRPEAVDKLRDRPIRS